MTYKEAIEEELKELDLPKAPVNLYDPLRYFLNLGGKRTRPTLLLMAYKLFDERWENALPQAIAIELFHNFTLIHDDIMDKASLRRSRTTVHTKWNDNIAILSGDVLSVKAYDYLMDCPPRHLKTTLQTFNTTARLVCEGQQMDMDFETQEAVSLDTYLQMIKHKTAVLLGCSLKIGAIIAEANSEQASLLYDFGVQLGIGFQLQDDYLDTFGDETDFGKTIGGDILNNKKTFLSIRLKDVVGEKTYKEFCEINDPDEKIVTVKNAIKHHKLEQEIMEQVSLYHTSSVDLLKQLDCSNSKRQLFDLAEKLMVRTV